MQKNKLKLFNLLLILFGNFIVATSISAENITNFKVFNNQRIQEQTILHYLKDFKGAKYNADLENEILTKLFNIGIFSDVKTEYNNGTISINVIENPIIANIALSGNTRFKSKDIFRNLFSKTGASFVKSNVDMDLLILQNIYTSKGSYLMNAKPEIVKINPSTVELKYNIEEGPISYVKNIYFVGLEKSKIPIRFLRAAMTTKSASLFNLLMNTPNYDPQKINQDIGTITTLLQSKGFMDASVNAIIAKVATSKGAFNITFYINEGQQYYFNKLSIKNNIGTPISFKSNWLKEGEIFNKSKLNAIIAYISDKLSKKGYPKVNITPNFTKNKNKVDIELVIENAQKYYIDKVVVFNNIKTKTPFILRKLGIQEGSIYDSSEITQGARKLMSTGYFHDVNPSIELNKQGKIKLKMRVEEKSTANLGFKGTIDDKGDITGNIDLGDRNFLGTGVGFNAQVGITTQGSANVYIGLNKSYLFDLDLNGDISFSHFSSNVTEDNFITNALGVKKESYNRKTTKISPSISYDLSDTIVHFLQYNFKFNDLTLNSSQKQKALENGDLVAVSELGKFYTSSLLNKFIVDLSPDKPFNDTNSSLSASVEVAGIGGDAKYFKLESEYKFVKQIKDDINLKFKIAGGAVFPYGDYKLKVSDKFELGIRGFESTGPRVDKRKALKDLNQDSILEKLEANSKSDLNPNKGVSLNGEYYYLISAQIDSVITQNDIFKLSAGPFIDLGSNWGCNTDTYKNKFIDSGALRGSIGVEALVYTMFFEFRFGLSHAFSKAPEDTDKVFHFKMSTDW